MSKKLEPGDAGYDLNGIVFNTYKTYAQTRRSEERSELNALKSVNSEDRIIYDSSYHVKNISAIVDYKMTSEHHANGVQMTVQDVDSYRSTVLQLAQTKISAHTIALDIHTTRLKEARNLLGYLTVQCKSSYKHTDSKLENSSNDVWTTVMRQLNNDLSAFQLFSRTCKRSAQIGQYLAQSGTFQVQAVSQIASRHDKTASTLSNTAMGHDCRKIHVLFHAATRMSCHLLTRDTPWTSVGLYIAKTVKPGCKCKQYTSSTALFFNVEKILQDGHTQFGLCSFQNVCLQATDDSITGFSMRTRVQQCYGHVQGTRCVTASPGPTIPIIVKGDFILTSGSCFTVNLYNNSVRAHPFYAIVSMLPDGQVSFELREKLHPIVYDLDSFVYASHRGWQMNLYRSGYGIHE
jgi:hypothetical protein